jgi:hypothetical protein
MNRWLLVLLSLASPLAIASTQKASPAAPAAGEPRQLTEPAMKLLAANDIEGMFAHIQAHMPLEAAELNKIRDTTVTQRKTLDATLGKYLGYAFIGECRKSDLLSRVTYVEKRAKNFVRWEFVLYKPRDRWQISAFYWDTKHAELFAPC